MDRFTEATQAQPGDRLSPLMVVARNTAADEQGSIHDEEYARSMGYKGGLVPGPTNLAYITRRLVDFFGPIWVEGGRIALRFSRPAYDGEQVTVHAIVRERQEREGGAELSLDCWLEDPEGKRCVEGSACCTVGEAPPPQPTPWPQVRPVRSRREGRSDALPPLRYEDVMVGEELRPLPFHISSEEGALWAAGADDHSSWYIDASPFGEAIVQPAMFSVDPINLIRHNFQRKASIFAACDLAYRAPGFVDRGYTISGYVVDKYERKGNQYIVVDSMTADEDGREIVRTRYTSLVRLRSEG